MKIIREAEPVPKKLVGEENDGTGNTGVQIEPVMGRVIGANVPCRRAVEGRSREGRKPSERPRFKCGKSTHFNKNCQYYVVIITERKKLDAYHKVSSGYSQSIDWVCGRTTDQRNFPDRLKWLRGRQGD